MSFKPMVQTDSTGKWYGNALAFATEAEALANAHEVDLVPYCLSLERCLADCIARLDLIDRRLRILTSSPDRHELGEVSRGVALLRTSPLARELSP